MVIHCISSEYYDFLLQSCKSCHLRCAKTPPLPCRSYCAAEAATPVTLHMKDNNWILWVVLSFFIVLIPTVILITIMVRRQMKKSVQEGSSAGINGNNKNDSKSDLGFLTTDERKQPMLHRANIAEGFNKDCELALCDYLFPLPAVEEGAAILVTTKTSACCDGAQV
ncbi:tumor necrosis factor receptor superfamily member 17 [Bombina bombina]|uniref:tumor necrosis factor receptor superfamily member 17 n=1 Tax=Bombina bombina TaxID=8345 RepID=UPI00235A4B0B|nr:tumor necrosis factor receptor superfamily member 17 [Bombina bombina]